MNSEQAKKLSLPDIMSRLGYEPVSIKKGGFEYWYASPFRKEKEPSFHTSFLGGKWIWNDFADRGGTVIDFVMRHENYQRVSDALRFLDDMFQGQLFTQKIIKPQKPFSFQQQRQSLAVDERQLEFISATDIQNPLIISYLTKERCIDEKIVRQYLKEVRYRNKANDKEYFAFGIENRSGGYEVRVASDKYPFKSALIKRDITVIPGCRSGNVVVNVFEGMTDFLSLLTMMKTDRLVGDALLMHSLSSYQRTVDFIKEEGYTRVNTFLDNNRSGKEHTEKFQNEFGKKIEEQSSMFLYNEDLNDLLIDCHNFIQFKH